MPKFLFSIVWTTTACQETPKKINIIQKVEKIFLDHRLTPNWTERKPLLYQSAEELPL